ncbi:hypothetical protein PtrSN002B_011592 [Pyrenophora tritici-repentis]|uniref:Uncharacterized protein n=1 Tax=Pyrenophora tritici-repentis TaxID=45151 RepID=A0A2W1CSH2_9PLEO|nr:hypothetical protein PtrM4_044640 [Pyrenophora tritici-repentis]KAI0569589.1 hypothetical protein Alg215_11554 [Pyrenophora tritici-repentis]KAI0585376.1 hypothetical protein Alg130_04744 [Pyrenophora tritici-repentis]KAI0609053.1 hypothetical protein TUN205_06720 [Pyrenophora tritici-repentis]KAI0624256.1 hypothetical protein TUN199_03706 [Pyrenophora tritici-repentis]
MVLAKCDILQIKILNSFLQYSSIQSHSFANNYILGEIVASEFRKSRIVTGFWQISVVTRVLIEHMNIMSFISIQNAYPSV